MNKDRAKDSGQSYVLRNGKQALGYTYDGLGRLTNKALYVYGDNAYDETVDTEYTYVDVTDSDIKTATLLKSNSTEGLTRVHF